MITFKLWNTDSHRNNTYKATTQLHIYTDTTNVVPGDTSSTIGTVDRMLVFPYSGTVDFKDYSFNPTENLTCDVLVVGGGGDGGKFGGGGGGGGILFRTDIKLRMNNIVSLKVGKGGAGATVNDYGVNGINGIECSITLSVFEYSVKGGDGG